MQTIEDVLAWCAEQKECLNKRLAMLEGREDPKMGTGITSTSETTQKSIEYVKGWRAEIDLSLPGYPETVALSALRHG